MSLFTFSSFFVFLPPIFPLYFFYEYCFSCMDVVILFQIQLERNMAKSETEMTKVASETELEEKSQIIAKLSSAGKFVFSVCVNDGVISRKLLYSFLEWFLTNALSLNLCKLLYFIATSKASDYRIDL